MTEPAHQHEDDVEEELRTIPPGATASQIARIVSESADFLVRAPWVAREAQTRLQHAIDDWDRDLAADTIEELLTYFDRWGRLAGTLHEAGSLGDLIPLEEYGLDLARDLDLGLLNQRVEDIRRVQVELMSSLLQTLRCDWLRGVPQQSAAEEPPSGFGAPPEVVERLHEACARLLEQMTQPRPEHVPLEPELDASLEATLVAQGARRMRSDELPDRDIVYEFLAHRFAYRPHNPEVAEALDAVGYRGDYLRYRTASGLDFFIVEPTGDRAPVVVFRGTEPDDLKDLKTDLEFQIGGEHFASAERLGLRALLLAVAASTGRPPDLTGHSLGGALAQLTASRFPELVGDVVTFQAPGLTRLNAFRGDVGLREHRPAPSPHPRVTHYVALNDVVHRAGQRHLEGRTVLAVGLHLDRGAGISRTIGHSDMLLGTHGLRERLETLDIEAHWTPHTYAIWGELPEHPTAQGSLHEAVRASVALSLDLLQAWLNREDPEALVKMVPHLARQALGEEDVTYPVIALRVARRIARDSSRVGARGVRLVGRKALRRG